MDKRVKYSFGEKHSVVRSVSSGKESIGAAARRLGCSRSIIQLWVEHYRHQGKAGLKLRVERYSGTFRIKVISHMLNKQLSLKDTCSLFGIPNICTVSRWLTIMKEQGVKGLLLLSRGRKRQTMARKKEVPKKDLTPEQQKLASLQAENEYLRAENAFLKKLDALLREQEAQQQQKQGRKPSGN